MLTIENSNITTGLTSPVTNSGLVVNGGGLGQPGNNNHTTTFINVTVNNSTLTSTGQSTVWLWGSTATLTATNSIFNGNGTPINFGTPGATAQEATAVTVQNGASATLTGGELNVGGADGFLPASKMALCVGGCGESGDPGANRGGTATLNGVAITVTPNNSAGIWVSRISNVNVTDGSITVVGNNGQGVHADANGSMTLNNVPITMEGSNSLGAFAFTAAVANLGSTGTPTAMITINGGSIMTTGADSTGAMASGADSRGVSATVALNGTTIETTGANSNGLAVCICGTPANGNAGPGAGGTAPSTVAMGGTITATDTTITTTGTGSNGAFAQDNGSISLTDSIVKLMQAGGGGAAYFANNGTITATNTTALTTGPNSYGGMLSNGGNLTITGGSVTTTGAGSFGFLVTPVTPVPFVTNVNVGDPGVSGTNAGAANTLTINEATVSSAADAFHVTDAIANIAVTGSTVTGNNGVLLNTVSSGTTNMTAASSQLTGAALTDSTSTANVTLEDKTTWTMTGSSNLTNLTNSASNIIYTPPVGDPTQLSSYKTLTVMNYTGVGGGITLNTFLGADSSPSDRLVINGGTGTGTTSLTINNTTGPGALTTANGILVVQAINGGTTTPTAAANGAAASGDAFSLGNPELRPGAFDYRLFRGGPVDSSDPTIANSWFLRSDFIVGPFPPPPGPVVPGPGPEVLPPSPPPSVLPPGLFPIIGPELATDGVVQPIARQMGLQTLGTLHQRIGDTLLLADGGEVLVTKDGLVTLANTGEGTGIARSDWARFFGQGIDNRYQAFAAPQASGWTGGFQGGVDLLRTSLWPGHRDVAGVYLAFANSDINVNGLVTNAAATGYVQTKTGTLGLSGYSAGGYWTHYGPTGWYLDLVLQGTYYQGNAITQFANLPINGSGFISSLEGGHPIPLPLGPRFVLEPEAQIIFQQVAFKDANDGLGPVGLGTTSGETQVWQPYGLVNLWRDWGGASMPKPAISLLSITSTSATASRATSACATSRRGRAGQSPRRRTQAWASSAAPNGFWPVISGRTVMGTSRNRSSDFSGED